MVRKWRERANLRDRRSIFSSRFTVVFLLPFGCPRTLVPTVRSLYSQGKAQSKLLLLPTFHTFSSFSSFSTTDFLCRLCPRDSSFPLLPSIVGTAPTCSRMRHALLAERKRERENGYRLPSQFRFRLSPLRLPSFHRPHSQSYNVNELPISGLGSESERDEAGKDPSWS